MAMLRCAPVLPRRRRPPAYPTKLQILATPQLLERRLPPAWAGNREIAAAVGVFLAAQATGCHHGSAIDKTVANQLPIAQQAVAPIFLHGEGRGATGCVVISPPVFLSEEEARQVIEEELAKFDICISSRDVDFEQIKIPPRYIHVTPQREDPVIVETVIESQKDARIMSVDLLDDDKRIAIEYITNTDHGVLGGLILEPGNWSSVTRYDFADTARYLADKIQETEPDVHFGVFYDPLICPAAFSRRNENNSPVTSLDWLSDSNAEEKRNLARQASKRMLREQVRDFVDWLKAQGVI